MFGAVSAGRIRMADAFVCVQFVHRCHGAVGGVDFGVYYGALFDQQKRTPVYEIELDFDDSHYACGGCAHLSYVRGGAADPSYEQKNVQGENGKRSSGGGAV